MIKHNKMKNIHLLLFTLLTVSCSTAPQPLVVGQDECSYCKMPIAEIKYGSEIITEKGKVFKYDDVGCMIKFLKNDFHGDASTITMYVALFSADHELKDVNKLVFLKSAEIHSPMNSGIAAFSSRQDAESLSSKFPGEILTWDQLQKQ